MIYAIAAVAIAVSVILAVRLREARTALDQAVAERDSYARLVDVWLRRVLDGDEHVGEVLDEMENNARRLGPIKED